MVSLCQSVIVMQSHHSTPWFTEFSEVICNCRFSLFAVQHAAQGDNLCLNKLWKQSIQSSWDISVWTNFSDWLTNRFNPTATHSYCDWKEILQLRSHRLNLWNRHFGVTVFLLFFVFFSYQYLIIFCWLKCFQPWLHFPKRTFYCRNGLMWV